MLTRRHFDKLHDWKPRVGVAVMVLVLFALLLATMAGCTTSSGAGRSTPVTAPAQPVSPHRFVPGERVTYRLDYTSASASDFRALFQPKTSAAAKTKQQDVPGLTQAFKTSVRGEFTSTVISNSGDTSLIAYSVRQPEVHLTVNGQEAADESERVTTDLSREVFATLNSRGSVLEVRFEPGVGDLSQNFVRTLLAITQFVFPEVNGSEPRRWETREADPNGLYVARYEEGTSSAKGAEEAAPRNQKSFRKIKTRYLQPAQSPTSNETQATTQIAPSGNLSARFDLQHGHLVSLIGTESQTIAVEGKAVASAKNAIQMDFLRQETLSQAEFETIRQTSIDRARVAVAIPLFVILDTEAGEKLIERTELGDESLENLLASLAKLESSTGQTNETPIYLKVKAMVYLHPESSATFGKILCTADAKGASMRILTGALAAVGNSDAQMALITATRCRAGDWLGLSLLIPAISQVPSPTQPAEDLLRDLAFNSTNPEIGATAQLSLGNVARQLAPIAPERSANIVRLFTKAMESSPSADVTQQMLLAIGNAGSIEALPTLTRFINDSSPTLRAAASAALRWVDSDQADAMLINALTSDKDATVRLEAALTLGFRRIGDSTFKAQKSAFLTDPDVKVRLAILQNLWNAHEVFPDVRQILKHAAARDRSKEIRKAAAESLGLK